MFVRRRWLEASRVAAAAAAVLVCDPARSPGAGRTGEAPPAGASAAAEGEHAIEARGPPPALAARRGSTRRAAREAGCLLFTERARTSTSADCLSCHGPGASAARRRACHPVGIDYAGAARARASLRPLDEVVRRGLSLPHGELRCVTCHDERSPWAFAVALPPGAAPKLEVDPADPRTFRRNPPPPPPAPGDRVAPAPLCVVCHLLG